MWLCTAKLFCDFRQSIIIKIKQKSQKEIIYKKKDTRKLCLVSFATAFQLALFAITVEHQTFPLLTALAHVMRSLDLKNRAKLKFNVRQIQIFFDRRAAESRAFRRSLINKINTTQMLLDYPQIESYQC